MKFLVSAILFLTLFSCASYKYDDSSRQENNKLIVRTNVPDANVNLAFSLINKKESDVSTSTKNKILNSYEATFTYNKLKFGRTFLKVSKTNYEPKVIKVWRIPRGSAFGRSFLLGCFTYLIPVAVDVFRSDFYKVAPWSREINVNLKYTQDFMEFRYKQIENSTNPNIFAEYIKEYPYSNYLKKAEVKKDSTELLEAVNKSTELAIDEYILSHKNSKFLKDANDIKSQMVAAKKEFEKAKSLNTVAAYEQFISKYPRSLQRKEAHLKLIDASEKVAISSSSLEKMLFYYESYLVKFKDFLTKELFKTKNESISKLIDNQIIVEYNPKKSWNYDEYKKVWKTYVQISEKFNGNIDNLEKSSEYRTKISNELIILFSKLTDEKQQKDFLSKSKLDFEKLSLENEEPFIVTLFNNSSNKNGVFKLYNLGFVVYSIDHTWEGDPLKGKDNFNYRGKDYQTFTGLNYEEFTFSNDKLKEIKLFNNKILLCNLKYYDDWTKLGEASFYLNGKLVRTDYTPDRNTYYFYEYDNGVNLSFKELEEKIKTGDAALAQKDYDKAIEIYTNTCKNDFPTNVPLNQRINASISNANNQKALYLRKLEQERLAEERKQEQIRQAEERKREQVRLAEEKRQEKLRLAEEKKRVLNNLQNDDRFEKIDENAKFYGTFKSNQSRITLNADRTGYGYIGNTFSLLPNGTFNFTWEKTSDQILISYTDNRASGGFEIYEKTGKLQLLINTRDFQVEIFNKVGF